ncbi:hypothetical protein E5288_WYG001427 [Bos mutus]|uniref:Solute carrier family 40 member n=1 Tax=Bos mutus TaxID=72004 RepID=A0A6B0R0C9_9CETA|nr:hypothetical protein [Bos mutus]
MELELNVKPRLGLWSFDITIIQLLQIILEAERSAVNGIQCSLNDLRDLIHFILVMLALGPQKQDLRLKLELDHDQ